MHYFMFYNTLHYHSILLGRPVLGSEMISTSAVIIIYAAWWGYTDTCAKIFDQD